MIVAECGEDPAHREDQLVSRESGPDATRNVNDASSAQHEDEHLPVLGQSSGTPARVGTDWAVVRGWLDAIQSRGSTQGDANFM